MFGEHVEHDRAPDSSENETRGFCFGDRFIRPNPCRRQSLLNRAADYIMMEKVPEAIEILDLLENEFSVSGTQSQDERVMYRDTLRLVCMALEGRNLQTERALLSIETLMGMYCPMPSSVSMLDLLYSPANLHVKKGCALFRRRQYREAVFSHTTAIEMFPLNPLAFASRSLAFAHLGRPKDAALDIEACEQIVNGSEEGLMQLRAIALTKLPWARAVCRASIDNTWEIVREYHAEEEVRMRNGQSEYALLSALNSSIDEDTISPQEPDSTSLSSWQRFGIAVRNPYEFNLLLGSLRSEMTQVIRMNLVSDCSLQAVTTLISKSRRMADDLLYYSLFSGREEESLSLEGLSRAMFALRYSDLLKSTSLVNELTDLQSAEELYLTPEDLVRCSRVVNGGVIIAYHLLKLTSEEIVVRWVIGSDGRILVQDSIVVENHFDFSLCEDLIPSFKTHFETLWNYLEACSKSSSRTSTSTATSESKQMMKRSMKSQKQACESLHLLLLHGLEEFLPEDGGHITFIPDEQLFQVPFGCLRNSRQKKYLIETHSFSISNSLRMHLINATQKERLEIEFPTNQLNGLICGHVEDASYTTEIVGVMKSLSTLGHEPCVVLRGRHYTPNETVSLINSYAPRFLHIASHGSESDPEEVVQEHANDLLYEFSVKGSVLCDDGTVLLAADVASNCDLSRTEITYLSCCSLGGGVANEVGVLGFASRACFRAGCPSVVCSLWPGASHVMRDIAIQFYSEMAGDGEQTKAQALRRAILFAIKPNPTIQRCPVLWSGIQLFGNPT